MKKRQIITKYTFIQILLVICVIFSCNKMPPSIHKTENKSKAILFSCDSLLKLYAMKPKIEVWINERPELLHDKETAFDILGDSMAKALGYTIETWKNGNSKDTIFMIGEGAKIELRIIPDTLLTYYCKEKPIYGMERREVWVKCDKKRFRRLGFDNSEDKILKNDGLEFPLPEAHNEIKGCNGSYRLFFKIIARNIFYQNGRGEKIILMPEFEWQAEIL
ncbi:MAG: hypothetical protein K1X92_16815 [Bacteroidia bacterium]|nr:hypothetical protein [Bacteroidia bacterium]